MSFIKVQQGLITAGVTSIFSLNKCYSSETRPESWIALKFLGKEQRGMVLFIEGTWEEIRAVDSGVLLGYFCPRQQMHIAWLM